MPIGRNRKGAGPFRTGPSQGAGHQQLDDVHFTKSGKAAVIAAAMIALTPGAATAAQETTTTTTERQQSARDDGEFPWGLLGLLGLAGLLGLRRKERDIHVDARRNP